MIIDTHTHAFACRYPFAPAVLDDEVWKISDRLRAGFSQRIARREWPWIEEYVERMDAWGIDVVCINNVACSHAGAREINEIYARLKSESNGRIEVLATIPLAAGEGGADELRRVVREYGFRGAKVYPKLQNVALDDPAMFPIYEAAADLGVPILTHVSAFPYAYTGHRVEDVDHTYDNLMRLFDGEIFKRFPTLKVIGAHLAGGLGYYKAQIVRRMPEYTNYFDRIYVDVAPASHYTAEEVLAAAAAFGEDHVLFATDFPFVSVDGVGECVAALQAMAISEGLRRKILGENAAALLGIQREGAGQFGEARHG